MCSDNAYDILKLMKNRGGAGYTLIEVLLFVGLTSFLLFIAISNINGNRANVQFSQGVRDFESAMSDIINDVPTGYFPTNDTINCVVPGPGRPQIQNSATPITTGSSEECIYVGKAIQFSPDGARDRVWLYNLAGRRLTATDVPVRTVTEAEPVAVAIPSDPTFNDSVVEVLLRNGIEVTRVFDGDTATTPPPASDSFGIVGVLTEFEGASLAESSPAGQSVQIGGLAGTVLGSESKTDAVADINTIVDANFTKPANGIVVCLSDGAGHTASLTLGAGGGSGVVLDIGNYNVGCN